MEAELKFNQELNNISLNFKLFNLLKYFLIHSYDSELSYLNKTLAVLKNYYYKEGKFHYTTFIDELRNIIFSTNDVSTSRKINMLVELINSNNHYELYDKITTTLKI